MGGGAGDLGLATLEFFKEETNILLWAFFVTSRKNLRVWYETVSFRTSDLGKTKSIFERKALERPNLKREG